MLLSPLRKIETIFTRYIEPWICVPGGCVGVTPAGGEIFAGSACWMYEVVSERANSRDPLDSIPKVPPSTLVLLK